MDKSTRSYLWQLLVSCRTIDCLLSWTSIFAKIFCIFSTLVGSCNMTLTLWVFEWWIWRKFNFFPCLFTSSLDQLLHFFFVSQQSALYVGDVWDLTFQMDIGKVACSFSVLSLLFILTDKVKVCLLSLMIFHSIVQRENIFIDRNYTTAYLHFVPLAFVPENIFFWNFPKINVTFFQTVAICFHIKSQIDPSTGKWYILKNQLVKQGCERL